MKLNVIKINDFFFKLTKIYRGKKRIKIPCKLSFASDYIIFFPCSTRTKLFARFSASVPRTPNF